MNPFLARLGLGGDDRVVVIHADDVGLCHASLQAFLELTACGALSSGAALVPSPWFPAVAARARAQPELDLGVHLALTSEWESFRWPALSTRDPASGLVDRDGYLPRSLAALAGAPADAVALELRAQLQRACDSGLDVTHVDTHMFSAFAPHALPAYVALARDARLPCLLLRDRRMRGLDEHTLALAAQCARAWEAWGGPLFDAVALMGLGTPVDRLGRVQQLLASLPSGLSLLISHPAVDAPELRAIAPDWTARVADYKTFRSDAFRRCVQSSGVIVVGYRALRDALRSALGSAVAVEARALETHC